MFGICMLDKSHRRHFSANVGGPHLVFQISNSVPETPLWNAKSPFLKVRSGTQQVRDQILWVVQGQNVDVLQQRLCRKTFIFMPPLNARYGPARPGTTTCNVQRAACDVQHAMRNGRRATCNVQCAMCNVPRAPCNEQRATCNVQHATCNV